MAGSIDKMRAAVDTINKAQPGYDQGQRWTFYSKGKVIAGKECDCSSVCGAIIQLGGYPIDLTGTFYTGNFNAKAKAAGFTERPFKASDVRPGDVINAPGKHVEFCYGTRKGHDGVWWYSARNDEKGGSHGGKTGDQGGKENVGFGRPYDMSKGGTRKAYILRPPAPPKPPAKPKPTSAQFRFGQANLHSSRFGGLPADSPRRGKYLAETLSCSLYALCELSEAERYATRDAMPGGRDRWKLEEVGYVCAMWDATKWTYKGVKRVTFDTKGVHGAVRAELVNKATGLKLDVIAVQVRPNAALTGDDAAKLKAKLGDVRKGLDLVRAGVPTVYAGDFNTSKAETVTVPPLVRATPNVDTMDDPGEQKLDAVFVTPDLERRDNTLHDGGSVTDHKCWVYNGTLGAHDGT